MNYGKLRPGTEKYAAVKKRYEAGLESAGYKRTQVGESVAWTRPAVVIDDDKVVPRDEEHEPPFDLDLYMLDFLDAIDADFTLWHLTYPEMPQSSGGSEGHKAGHEAFAKALREAMGKKTE